MQRVDVVVIDGGRLYQIAATSLSGNPLDDPEIATTINSFHFLGRATAVPANSPGRDPADRIPELIGRLTFYVLIGVVVVFLIVKGIAGKRKPNPDKGTK